MENGTAVEQLEARRADLARQVEEADQEAKAAQARVASGDQAALKRAIEARARHEVLAGALAAVRADLARTASEAARQIVEATLQTVIEAARQAVAGGNAAAAEMNAAAAEMEETMRRGALRYLAALRRMEGHESDYLKVVSERCPVGNLEFGFAAAIAEVEGQLRAQGVANREPMNQARNFLSTPGANVFATLVRDAILQQKAAG
jgi:rubrerythrin